MKRHALLEHEPSPVADPIAEIQKFGRSRDGVPSSGRAVSDERGADYGCCYDVSVLNLDIGVVAVVCSNTDFEVYWEGGLVDFCCNGPWWMLKQQN